MSKARYHLNWIDVTFILKPEFPNNFRVLKTTIFFLIIDHTIMSLFEQLEFKNYRESLEQEQSTTLREGVGKLLYNQTVTLPYPKLVKSLQLLGTFSNESD